MIYLNFSQHKRKSYGKAKKVTFRQQSNSDGDTRTHVAEARSSDEDFCDLTFQEPNAKQKVTKKKKKKPKKQFSKKEVCNFTFTVFITVYNVLN